MNLARPRVFECVDKHNAQQFGRRMLRHARAGLVIPFSYPLELLISANRVFLFFPLAQSLELDLRKEAEERGPWLRHHLGELVFLFHDVGQFLFGLATPASPVRSRNLKGEAAISTIMTPISPGPISGVPTNPPETGSVRMRLRPFTRRQPLGLRFSASAFTVSRDIRNAAMSPCAPYIHTHEWDWRAFGSSS